MEFIAWVVLAFAISLVAAGITGIIVEARRIKRETEALQLKIKNACSSSMQISKPGLGWVPANGYFSRH